MAVKVSVLMSVYDPEWEYLRLTLDSLSGQSYRDFELVLVNDGADDEKLGMLLRDYSFDVVLVKNPVNLGLPGALNEGLKKCTGEYIARIDDDDIMETGRLEAQVAFMEEHPDILSLSSGYTIIDEDGREIGVNTYDRLRDLKGTLLYKGNCLCHSTLFARKSALEEIGGYDQKMTYAQDYDLYLRLIRKGKIHVIPDKLIKFRSAPGRISRNKRILSTLFSYYASLKNMDGFEAKIFWRRAVITLRQLYVNLK